MRPQSKVAIEAGICAGSPPNAAFCAFPFIHFLSFPFGAKKEK